MSAGSSVRPGQVRSLTWGGRKLYRSEWGLLETSIKEQTSTSRFEDLIAFIKRLTNGAVSHLEGHSKAMYNMKGLERKKDGAWELLTKKKKRIMFRLGHPLFGGVGGGEENSKGFYHADFLFLCEGWREGPQDR